MSSFPGTGPTPADLFLNYYARAACWTGSQRATAVTPDLAFDDLARTFLSLDDGEEATKRLMSLVEDKACSIVAMRGRVLAALKAIDAAFYHIHPRALVGVTSPTVAGWLRDARLARFASGAYAHTGSHRLIARGPLLRDARHLHASSGDLLSDYFAALAVAPTRIEHDGRAIAIRMRMIDHNAFTGVSLAHNLGSETIGFLPLASNPGELVALPKKRNGRIFAAYGPTAGFDAAAAAMDGLLALGGVDIAIMPELALSEAHVDRLGAMLESETRTVARLIVAGSYSTSAVSDDGQPWNECRVLNSQGVELWRQRKLWTAGVTQGNAIRFGIPDPGVDTLTLEDNAAGDELVVADVDGFGRCVVLICQDCEMPVLVPAVFTAYQPDWVFTPIFDCTLDPGRWAHARTFGLSQLSQARCVAVTNMSFAKAGANMGLAVGPKEAAGSRADEIDRAVRVVTKPPHGSAMMATLTWRQGDWDQSWLEARPVSRPALP